MLPLSFLLLTASPVVRVGNTCPPGYMLSTSYCIPRSPQTRPSLKLEGDHCPRGYFITNVYCTKAP